MRETVIELRKLTADEEFILTNGEAYGKEVYLAKNDSADNWREISQAEYDVILAEMEEKLGGVEHGEQAEAD